MTIITVTYPLKGGGHGQTSGELGLVTAGGAQSSSQFDPASLGGGQGEWVLIDFVPALQVLNPNPAVQHWLWQHDSNGWIYWRYKKDNSLLCWPKIAIFDNLILTNGYGKMLEVLGIPADADIDSMVTHWQDWPYWFHICKNNLGNVILRGGSMAIMPVVAPQGRSVKGAQYLEIDSNMVQPASGVPDEPPVEPPPDQPPAPVTITIPAKTPFFINAYISNKVDVTKVAMTLPVLESVNGRAHVQFVVNGTTNIDWWVNE